MKSAVAPTKRTARKSNDPPIVEVDFPGAIRAVIDGKRVTKREWNNPGEYIALIDHRLRIHKSNGAEHDLLVSEGDLNGLDWFALP